MTGYHPLGSQPLGVLFDTPRTGLSRFDGLSDLLADAAPAVVHTVEIEPKVTSGGYRRLYGTLGYRPLATLFTELSTASTTVKRIISDWGFFTDHDDINADTAFAARIDNALRWRRSIIDGGIMWGRRSTRAATITANNVDQHIERIINRGEFDGRVVTVRFGRPNWKHRQFATLFKGVFRRARHDLTQTTIECGGISARLNIPIQSDTYAGTGGADGGSDLKDQPKPLSFGGQHKNVTPPLVNSSGLIFHLTSNNGAASVDAVYDKGAALSVDTGIGSSGEFATYALLDAATVAASKYAYVLDENGNAYVKLGSTPEGGAVTVDFTTSTTTTLPGAVIKQIIKEQGGLDDSDLQVASFAGLDAEVPYDVERWIGPGEATEEIPRFVDEICRGIVSYWGDDRYNRITVGYLKKPSGGHAVELTDADILDYRRRALPGRLDPAVKIARIGFQRNYTVQRDDLAGSAADAYRAFVREQYRYGAASNSDTATKHTEARTLVLPSQLVSEAAADALAAHITDDLFDSDASMIEVDANFSTALVSVGEVVKINSAELNISTIYRVVGATYDAASLATTLTLFR